MSITEKDIKRISVLLVIAILLILAFFILKPVFFSVMWGLILAYIFFPVYKVTKKLLRNSSISALVVCLIVLSIIVLPLWFLIPILVNQVASFISYSQNLDIRTIITNIFPTASEKLKTQIEISVNNGISQITNFIFRSLTNFILNFWNVLLNLLLAGFVFFFALRDHDKLKDFVSGLMPLNKNQEKLIVEQFENITKSLIYGQVIIGISQGIFAGLGFFLFNIPNALLLTILSIVLGILPIIGPGLIYIPATLYLLTNSTPLSAVIYFLYNIIIVSHLDNILRSYLISRKSILSSAIVLIGMIGGFLSFGLIGLFIGPLVLTYFITFLKAYKEKKLSSFFSDT